MQMKGICSEEMTAEGAFFYTDTVATNAF